jgi:hypothetical protein
VARSRASSRPWRALRRTRGRAGWPASADRPCSGRRRNCLCSAAAAAAKRSRCLATVRGLMFRVLAMSRLDWPCASWWMICASRSVSPALISASVISVPSQCARELGLQLALGDGVPEGLDEQRASAGQQLALPVGVVVVGAAERDREQPVRAGRERERDLVLDPERGVHLLVEGERPQLAAGDQVRAAVGAPVAGPGEVSGDRVLVAVADERLQRLAGEGGLRDADHGGSGPRSFNDAYSDGTARRSASSKPPRNSSRSARPITSSTSASSPASIDLTPRDFRVHHFDVRGAVDRTSPRL